jgi:hypothetical protein
MDDFSELKQLSNAEPSGILCVSANFTSDVFGMKAISLINILALPLQMPYRSDGRHYLLMLALGLRLP